LALNIGRLLSQVKFLLFRTAPVAFCLAVIAILQAAIAQEPDANRAARLMDSLMWGQGRVGGAFSLTDQNGKTRTDSDFRGKLLVVYFGYTACPDICPADLIEIGAAMDKLGMESEAVQPLFISVDPERDTISVLAAYMPNFHSRIIGLTGTAEQIAAIADAYKVYYARYTPPDGSDYLIDHSGFIYLMGRSGEYLGVFPPRTSADRMVEVIRQHLERR
jgi:protein SCO1/2